MSDLASRPDPAALSARPSPPSASALAAFHATRAVMIAAWRRWLATQPQARDIADELSGTASAMRQLHDLGAANA